MVKEGPLARAGDGLVLHGRHVTGLYRKEATVRRGHGQRLGLASVYGRRRWAAGRRPCLDTKVYNPAGAESATLDGSPHVRVAGR